MKLQGIKTEYKPNGRVKRVIIDGSAKTELVEDLLDIIAYEAAKDEETVPWEEVKAKLNKKHGIK